MRKTSVVKTDASSSRRSASPPGESDTDSKSSSQCLDGHPLLQLGSAVVPSSGAWSNATFCVPSAVLSYTKESYGVTYTIEARLGQEVYQCEKRFSDLQHTHEALSKIHKDAVKSQSAGGGSGWSNFLHRPRGNSTTPLPPHITVTATASQSFPTYLSTPASPAKTALASPIQQQSPLHQYQPPNVLGTVSPPPRDVLRNTSSLHLDPTSNSESRHVRTSSSASSSASAGSVLASPISVPTTAAGDRSTTTTTSTGSSTATNNSQSMPNFPKKRMMGSTNTSILYIIERRYHLDVYFRQLPLILLKEDATSRVLETLFSSISTTGGRFDRHKSIRGTRKSSPSTPGKKQIHSYFSLGSKFLYCRSQSWYNASHLEDWSNPTTTSTTTSVVSNSSLSSPSVQDRLPRTVPRAEAGLLPTISVRLPHSWLEVDSIRHVDKDCSPSSFTPIGPPQRRFSGFSGMTQETSSASLGGSSRSGDDHRGSGSGSTPKFGIGGTIRAVIESNKDEGRSYRKYRFVEFLHFYDFLATREGGLLPDVAQVKEFFQRYRAKNPVTTLDLLGSFRSLDNSGGSKLAISLKGRESLPTLTTSGSRGAKEPRTPRPSQLRNLRNSSELLALLAGSLATSHPSQLGGTSAQSFRQPDGECSNSTHLEWREPSTYGGETVDADGAAELQQCKYVRNSNCEEERGWILSTMCLCTDRRYCVSSGIGGENAVMTQLRPFNCSGGATLTIHPPVLPAEDVELDVMGGSLPPMGDVVGDNGCCEFTNHSTTGTTLLVVGSRTDIPVNDLVLLEENRLADEEGDFTHDPDEVET